MIQARSRAARRANVVGTGPAQWQISPFGRIVQQFKMPLPQLPTLQALPLLHWKQREVGLRAGQRLNLEAAAALETRQSQATPGQFFRTRPRRWRGGARDIDRLAGATLGCSRR